MASLALLENETAVIYIDTTNYVNHENMSLVLSVSIQIYFFDPIFLPSRTSSKRLSPKQRQLESSKPFLASE